MNNKSFIQRSFSNFLKQKSQWKEPLRVAITGANGNIGYAIAFRIANGEMLGHDQPIILNLVDLPQFEKGLEGLKMELNDCAFPLLKGINVSTKVQDGFKDINYALLVGAKPRGPGMERGDLLNDNGKIFIEQGKALGDHASRDCKVLVVGNPANTNCLIAQHHAKGLAKENFSAMTRLDHNRSIYALSHKLGCDVDEIDHFCIWGNHSPTMFPDTFNATIKGKNFHKSLDNQWRVDSFIPEVQQRGAAIIKQRGLSSAASAGNAAIEHMRDWHNGTNNKWTSMGVYSNGEYGIEKGLIYSYPVIIENQKYKIVENIPIGDEQRQMMKITENELIKERELISHLLKQQLQQIQYFKYQIYNEWNLFY